MGGFPGKPDFEWVSKELESVNIGRATHRHTRTPFLEEGTAGGEGWRGSRGSCQMLRGKENHIPQGSSHVCMSILAMTLYFHFHIHQIMFLPPGRKQSKSKHTGRRGSLEWTQGHLCKWLCNKHVFALPPRHPQLMDTSFYHTVFKY